MTIEKPVYELEHIEFCQCHPVWNGEQYCMVRDPRVSISKDCVSLKPLDKPLICRRWVKTVGQGGLSLTAGIPVCQEFYQCFIREGGNVRELVDPTLEGGFFRLSQGMSRGYSSITPRSRYSFWLAFNISPAGQECLEAYYGSYKMSNGDIRTRFKPLPLMLG